MSKQDETLTDLFSDSVFNVDSINNKSSFSHIPMDAAINRVDNGTGLMAEISKIFQARLDVEDREIGFSIRVSRPNLYELEIPSSSAEKALGYLKNYYLYVSREQASYRRNLDEDLLSELEESRLKRLNQVTEHKNNISESTEEAVEASSNLIAAKQAYIKVLGEVEIVQQKLSAAVTTLHALKNMTDAQRKKKKEEENKYSMGRLFSAFERTPEEECKHQSKKLRKLESLAADKQQDIEGKKTILLEKIQKKESFYAQAAVAFEKAESDRLFHTEKALKQYCSIEKQALEARIRLLTSFEEGAIAQLDAQGDVELFASKNRDVDNTRMCSNALKMMEWDFKTRVETGGKSAQELSDSSLSLRLSPGRHSSTTGSAGAGGAGSGSVWADVEGDGSGDKETEMRPLHHDPDFVALEEIHAWDRDRVREGGGEGGGVEEQQEVEEVTRILDEHFEAKPTLEYLFSKLKTKVDAEKTKEEKEKKEKEEREGEVAVGMRDSGELNGTEKPSSGSGSVAAGSRDETDSDPTKTKTNDNNDNDNNNGNNASMSESVSAVAGRDNVEDDNDDDDDDDNEADISSEETRALLCVSLLNEEIFAGSATTTTTATTSTEAAGGGEGSEGGAAASSASAKAKRRVHCLSVVGFSMERGRNAFLQILDDKRGRFATLDAPSFECMTVAMKIFLDKCQSPRRVKCALRLANMSITFHKQKQILVSSESTTTTKTDTKTDSDSDSDTPQHNHYVQCEPEINQHELWHTAGFWEDALSHGLREQMVMMDPVQWDELEPELLNEKVMAIHNIVFGQLGTLAFTMHEMGLEKTYVQRLVMNLGKSSQLGDDLLIELFKSIQSFGCDADDSDLDYSKTSSSSSPSEKDVKSTPVTVTVSAPAHTTATTTAVSNEYMTEPHEHGMLDKSKEPDVKGLL